MLNRETVDREEKAPFGSQKLHKRKNNSTAEGFGFLLCESASVGFAQVFIIYEAPECVCCRWILFRKKTEKPKVKKKSDLEQLKRGRKIFYKFGLTVISIGYMIYCQIHPVNASDTSFIINREHIITDKLNLFY